MYNKHLILTPLDKAIDSLKRALEQEKNEFTRDAVIQRFKYTYELSWKFLKRYLSTQTGSKEFNIKDIYREAAKQGLIENLEGWFDYHQARIITFHNYNEITAEDTYLTAQKFIHDADMLFKNLKHATEHSN